MFSGDGTGDFKGDKIMSVKEVLKKNCITKYPYEFLFNCKYFGLRNTLYKIAMKVLAPKVDYEKIEEKQNEKQEVENKEQKITVGIVDNRSYKLPPILIENNTGRKTLEIISCAFRKHEPQKGLTGGPNGVLATQREVFGNIYHGMRMRYLFHSVDVVYPEHLERALKGLSFMVRINFYAAYYLEYCINSWCRLNKNTDFFFVCHDLGFAYAAYLRNCKYVLVWHTQGSMINERESFGEILSERDKEVLNKLERVVFENAEAVYFPSFGAKESYIKTARIDTSKIHFAEKPLYNTISNKPKNLKVEDLLSKLNLEKVNRKNVDIFLSVGDFSDNKGMERVPAILNCYVKETGRSVYWIAIGSRHKAGIFERLEKEKSEWKFKCFLKGERVDHDTLLALMEYADYYIMMQRHSIFDLSTLEAMRAGKALILSAVGGNLEVNCENNVVFVESDKIEIAVSEMKKRNKYEWGALNKKVFNKYFSKECFFNSYAEMIDEMAKKSGIEFNRKSEINRNELSKWKGKYVGKTAVICGAGSSLDNLVLQDHAIYMALNRALFYDKVKFDYLFMQDAPKNQPYTIEDYNNYPCTKFYGIISNPGTVSMGLSKEDYMENISGEIINYELAPMWYDYRVDEIKFNLDVECILDAKSVVFSAIQFAVYAGFKEIILYGVDFSENNFGNSANPNKYADSVEGNLIAFKKAIKKQYPNIVFRFGSTHNENLQKAFDAIDQGKL